jgi:alkanesulfonate monooxygenase SsuD/methylene tetrahydromethanopterin reductase-like flavin-dependent oxidoreductase (luciferase family)
MIGAYIGLPTVIGDQIMQRLKFGAFLAPHHPIGENPMLQFRRDIDLVEQLDGLGYDEFWCGEHHSSGWEMIASPEMFLAAAGERSKRIKLGTGVISLPYHHPYNVAQRMVQLDHMTGGRAIFGSGPGALASDAHTLGIDPMLQRDRQDHAIGIIRRLFKGERVTDKTDWYTMQDAALQLLPLQEDMPFVVASQISPSGMTLAGKHGIGIISIGSMSNEGLLALPTQWKFAEDAAKKHGQTVDRRNWRVLLSWHVAETREKAERGGARGTAPVAQRIHRRDLAAARRRALRQSRRGGGQDRLHAGIGRDDRHARRSREGHQGRLRQERRLRHGGGLRPRLGQSGEHAPQLGHGRALRHSGDQRLRDQAARIAEVPDRESRRCSSGRSRRSWRRSCRPRAAPKPSRSPSRRALRPLRPRCRISRKRTPAERDDGAAPLAPPQFCCCRQTKIELIV